MDIDYLLVILPSIIFIGFFGLILIVWHGNFRRKKAEGKLTKPDAGKESSKIAVKNSASSHLDPTLNDLSAGETNTPPAVHHDINDYIILQLMAPQQRPYRGYELIQTLSSVGFHYGKMNIFHYYADPLEKKELLFSLTSAIEPGTFDLDHIGEINCPGLCLFMSIPKVNAARTTFELMLETAQVLIQDLGGTLCDKQLRALTADELSHYYSQLHSYA
jgi:cell division protein ZipA